MEGVLRAQGSQDISPPKDTAEDALPDQTPSLPNPAAHLQVSPAPQEVSAAGPAPAEEPAAEPMEVADHTAPAEVAFPPQAKVQ